MKRFAAGCAFVAAIALGLAYQQSGRVATRDAVIKATADSLRGARSAARFTLDTMRISHAQREVRSKAQADSLVALLRQRPRVITDTQAFIRYVTDTLEPMCAVCAANVDTTVRNIGIERRVVDTVLRIDTSETAFYRNLYAAEKKKRRPIPCGLALGYGLSVANNQPLRHAAFVGFACRFWP